MNYYRVLDASEETKYERILADAVRTVCCKRQAIPDVKLEFIEECAYGPHAFDAPVYGFHKRGSQEIFIRRGLSERDLVLTVAHECRHAYQAKTGKHSRDIEAKERDARIAEFELGILPSDPRELRIWILRELEFERNPGLRETYAQVDAMMARRRAPAPKAPEVRRLEYALRPERIATSKDERIAYIRQLLGRLPNEPKFQGQRSKLAEELAELIRGVAA